jgi:hypothetical protein
MEGHHQDDTRRAGTSQFAQPDVSYRIYQRKLLHVAAGLIPLPWRENLAESLRTTCILL